MLRRAAPLLLVALAACGGSEIVIDSDTNWNGTIEGPNRHGVYQGFGYHEFELDAGQTCWAIQKQGTGYVRVYVRKHTLTGTDVLGDSTTREPIGVVSGCAG